ncbi:sugar kinase [Aureimonas sp. SA4125]|uniref:ROK family protein n=1 Tax=Aureimonas sp. SA4125 TaxID=2826993 RepID=UPI001CC44BB5|nr:ROK family protein [Aureimonas sp. SA4125]BDA83896.1 sugar kinase [Aureimonas sp. SA4125]
MLSKADADAVRSQNRRIILDHFRRFKVSTRRRMSEATGLSLSSTSAIGSDMVRSSILSEIGAAEPPKGRGRPEVSLELCGALASVAAVNITVGEIAVTICDYAGATLATGRRELDLSHLSPEELVEAVLTLLARTTAGGMAGEGALRQIVVCVQGVTDAADRRIAWSPVLAMRDVDIATPIEAATGAVTRVLNDCGAMPERFRWGNELESSDFATLFIGFGVGMGLKLGGRTFRGSHTSAAEFGHLNHIPRGDLCRCGNRGCIEAYAGDYAIWRAARGAPSAVERRVPDADMRALAAAARGGEVAAREAFARAGEAIGYGLGRMFALIDPLPIVFVGSGAAAMDLLEPSIRRGIAESAIAGAGADVAFHVLPDVDRVTMEAATTLALAAVDEEMARGPGAGARTELAARFLTPEPAP